jgi:FAD/FMN-containing dehydrogenase
LALSIHALPAHGIVWAGGDLSGPQAESLDESILESLAEIGGHRAWHRRPIAATSIAPFAPQPSDLPMLRALKARMDPNRIFNPGRWLRRGAEEPR